MLENPNIDKSDLSELIVGGGCHWTIDALFRKIKGVSDVQSGYYHLQDNGSDRIEVVHFKYNPEIISLKALLLMFFSMHNPTLIRWGVPESFPYYLYRSLIVTFDKEQLEQAQEMIKLLDDEAIFESMIETKTFLYAENRFHLAEEQWQDYYCKRPNDPYSVSNIVPKLQKLHMRFAEYLK
jgi:peptide-methionine (S)-S-oxide reductase